MKITSRRGKSSSSPEAQRTKVVWFRSSCVALLILGSLWVIGASLCGDNEQESMAGGLLGGPKDVKNVENSLEIDEIARFAVTEHNTKEGKNLTFGKVVSAKTQVVSGIMYHLVLEATHEAADKPTLFDAKVWTKPWESHKTLQHFKESEGSHSLSSGTQGISGLREISVEDPVIKEAAEHALKGLNDKSNSLVPYVLKDIQSALAEAGDEETQFELHITVSRGAKDEKLKAGLHRTAEGKWTIKHSSLM